MSKSERFEMTAGDLFVAVDSKGAELKALRKGGVPYLYEGDSPKHWAKSAPILFPVVGRCVDDILVVEGRPYPMPRHGFARDLFWEPVSGTDTSVEFALVDSPATLKHYPYSFELTATYELDPNELRCRYRLENLEEHAIPFSFGLHPAFRWPLDPATPRESWRVVFPNRVRQDRVFLEDGLRGRRHEGFMNKPELALKDELFVEDAIVIKNPAVNEVALSSESSPRSVKIKFSDATWMGIWSVPGAPFVCLEPWRGVAAYKDDSGDVESKDGIEWLEPGATFAFDMTIEPA